MKLTLLWSLTCLNIATVSAFVAPRPASLRTGLCLREKNLVEDIQDKFKDAGERADRLGDIGEDGPVNDEQVKLVLQYLDEIEGKPSAEAKTYAFEEVEKSPSLLALFIKLFAKELFSGRVDGEWIRLVAAAAFLETVVKIFRIERIAESAKGIRKVLAEAVSKSIDDQLNYTTYPHHPEYDEVPLKGLMKMVDGVPPIQYWFSLKKILRVVIRLLFGELGLVINAVDPDTDENSEESYENYYRIKLLGGLLSFDNPLYPEPYVFNHWEEDKEFARQFLNGVNPVMIRVVDDLDAQLTPELIDFFETDDTLNLEALVRSKRLLYVSYDDLKFPEETIKNPHSAYPEVLHPDDPRSKTELRYFSHAVVLFLLSRDRKELDVLAIELDGKPNSVVYTADTTDPETWLFAKSTVAAADSQFHEWVSHLGMTHLTVEPHIVAIHNTLRRASHPVFTFLRPLTRDMLLLNWAARLTLASFGPESFGDTVTSVGVGQFMQLILNYWKEYDFFESSALDRELASRGFTEDFDIPCYRYRTDGLKLFRSYEKFARGFVDEVYDSDEQVKNDSVLQEWAKETTDPNGAAIPGFPKSFNDKETLASTLQTLFWVSSGLHAAVNFPQYDYYAYQANKPLGIRQSMEQFLDSPEQTREWMFREAFPLLSAGDDVAATSRLLTLPSKVTIDKLDDFFDDIGKASYEAFKEDLREIGEEIDERTAKDEAKGRATYTYLHPKNVPASIDI